MCVRVRGIYRIYFGDASFISLDHAEMVTLEFRVWRREFYIKKNISKIYTQKIGGGDVPGAPPPKSASGLCIIWSVCHCIIARRYLLTSNSSFFVVIIVPYQ